MTPLYIDPGTGSMLFSILIGAAATLYFLARALIIRAKVFFSGGRASAGNVQPYVIYSEGKQYWSVFKPILDEFERRGIDLVYYCAAGDDPVFGEGYRHIKAEAIGEGNRAFARLNFLSADFVLMTTPGLDVYQLKRSKSVKHYSHINHSPTDLVFYHMFGIDYFDSILLSGSYQEKELRELEALRRLPARELVTAGCTYLDVFAERLKEIPDEGERPFTVLVSPSWGASGLLSCYGKRLLDPLVKTGMRIIIRPHPQSVKSEAALLEELAKRYGGDKNVSWDYERDNLYSLKKADIMITDFSGIIFDYIFLRDRPVLYVNQSFDFRPYDAWFISGKTWQFSAMEEFGIELREEFFETIGDVIKSASDSPALKAARRRARETAWQYRGEAGKRAADYMISVVNRA
ncbi:MAG: CDP-glycerol glycerophosphotransferase family protein [Treponema sp.]|jgi:hypothetical protein|nr:CDP-glycerol glycerophosphotransferase family protein [Treponema sp.]